MCDCFSGGLGLLYKKSLTFWTKLSICCFLQEKIRSHRTLLNLYEELLQARKKPIYCMSKIQSFHYMHIHTHLLYIHTLFCSSSVFRLSRLLKIRSLCSSLLALLINLQTASLSASNFCQELRVALR